MVVYLLHRKPDLTRRRFLDLIRLTFCVLASAWVALGVSTSYGQTQMTAAAAFATKYFLDAPPTKDDLVNLPPQARDLIVAKVRLSKAVWLGPRDQSGMPGPPTKSVLFAEIELLDVLSGTAKSGDQLEVFIAATPGVRRYITPLTPAMEAREYFIATFLDRENQRQLLGLPATQDEFERWEAEWMAYERMRDRPGSRN
jgi:hypothetical protein